MPRVVLDRRRRQVTGNVILANGGGSTWQSSAGVTVQWGAWIISFGSNSGMGYGWGQGTSPSVGASVVLYGYYGAQAGISFDDAPNRGRGTATIEGTFALEGEAELCLYTKGEDIPPDGTPQDAFPTYGGARSYELQSNYGTLVWEWVKDTPTTAKITMGGRSAQVTIPFSHFSDSIMASVSVIDDSWQDSGGVTAAVSFGGVPIEGETRWKEFYGRHDGLPQNPEQLGAKVEVGTGFVRVMNRGWIRSSVLEATSAGVTAYMSVPRVAAIHLDAMAGDQPHPYPCEWKVIDEWVFARDGQLLCPPEPRVVTLRGQSVTHKVRQNSIGINHSTYNKSITRTATSGNWNPVSGYIDCPRNTIWRSYHHFERTTGPVYGWIVPPPGENPKDWRVGWRGKEFDALKIDMQDTTVLPTPQWTSSGNVHTGTWSPAAWLEGYRFLRVEAPNELKKIAIDGKEWSVDMSTPGGNVIDLCCPDNATAKIETKNTRWPLDKGTMRPKEEGALWGVNEAQSIVCHGAKPTKLELILKDKFSAHALEVFGEEHEWKDPDGPFDDSEWYLEHFVQRCMVTEADGRQNGEFFDMRHTVSGAPGRRYPDDYYPESISGVAGQINQLPWLSATEAGGFPDPYHTNALPAHFLGLGYTASSGNWRKGWDKAENAWLKAQPFFDSLEWRDVVGDVFGVGDGGDKELQLYGRKVFRSRAWGVVHDGGDGKRAEAPDPACEVIGSDKGGGNEISTTTSADIATYDIGPTRNPANDWGVVKARQEKDGKESWKSDPVTVGGVPRLFQRVSFRLASPHEEGNPFVLQDRWGRYHRVNVKDGDVVYRRAHSAINVPNWWIETVVADSGDCSGPKIALDGLQRIWCVFARRQGEAHSIWRAVSDDDGATWTTPEMAIPNGKHPTIATDPDGSVVVGAFVHRSGNDGPGTIKATFRRAGDTSPSSPFEFADEGGQPLIVADDSFHLAFAHEYASRWVMACVIEGESSPSDWWSSDDCRHWKRVT